MAATLRPGQAAAVTAGTAHRCGGVRLGMAGHRPGTAPRDAIGWLVIVAVMGWVTARAVVASWRVRRVTVG
jgi:hypothetical protein